MGKRSLIRWIVARAIRRRRSVGEYSQTELTDLEHLGQESKGGEEKGWVISALRVLADNVLTSPQYSGGQLEGLITTLSEVLLEGTVRGTPENFRSSIELLRRVVRTNYQRAAITPDFVDADLAHAIRTLSLLARQALGFPQQGITATCLAILSDHATATNPANSAISQALREIGTEAIARDQLALALEALTPLDIVVFASDDAPFDDELLYDFLGLLSALWKHGVSGEEKAGEYLADLVAKPGLDMDDLLWRTVYHHRRTNRFAVADRVIEMYRQWSLQRPDFNAVPASAGSVEPSG
jgi:hypothetical protein